MAVVKLAGKEKKAVQFIDDDGHIFQTSVAYMKQMLDGVTKGQFVLLTRMPFDASPDRFKKSPVWQGSNVVASDASKVSTDALSVKATEEAKQSKVYNEDVIL